MKRPLCSRTGRIVEMAILTKVAYKIEWNPSQKANTILHGNIKSNLKIYLETQKSSDTQINPVLPTPNQEGKKVIKQAEVSPYLISRCVTDPKLSPVLAQSEIQIGGTE